MISNCWINKWLPKAPFHHYPCNTHWYELFNYDFSVTFKLKLNLTLRMMMIPIFAYLFLLTTTFSLNLHYIHTFAQILHTIRSILDALFLLLSFGIFWRRNQVITFNSNFSKNTKFRINPKFITMYPNNRGLLTHPSILTCMHLEWEMF